MKIITAAILFATVATPVLAQQSCPVAADLARGIVVEFPDGSTETFRQAAPGIVAVTGTGQDGSVYTMQLAHGFHLLQWEVPGDPDSRIDYDYGMPLDAMPRPTDGGRWHSAVHVTAWDGPRSEAQIHAYGATTSISIGACTYMSIEAIMSYDTPDHYLESVIWLPELGISYLYWNESDDYTRQPISAVGIRAGK